MIDPSRSKMIRVLLLTCASAHPTAWPQNNTTLQQAVELFTARDLPRADSFTRAYLAQHPESAPAMFLLGRVLEARNQPVESLEWFTRAAAKQDPGAEDLRLVAMDYVLLNSYGDAARWLTQSLQLDRNNAEAWYDLGRVNMMQGNLQAARAPLERSLALKPRQAKVANNLGVIAEGDNAPEQAEALYRQAILWQTPGDPLSEQPYTNLGALLLLKQKGAEALPLLEKAVKIAPSDAKCHEQLARAEEQQGNPIRAIAELEAAVQLAPASAHLHYQLGQLYRHTGNPEKAKAELLLSGKLYERHSSDQEQ